jgi:aspartate aminotransferase
MEQWAQISQACKEKSHFVLFDNAYQGFASGNTDTDIRSVKLFIDQGHNIGLCQSFAKNFGLYGQRVGMFSVLCADADEAQRVDSQVKILARSMYSNPPLHGARIVATVLGDPKLKEMWQGEIATMASRIIAMRSLLKNKLIDLGSKKNWDHITNQIGMFSYTGVTPEQCDRLTKEHHIYLTRNGRISMAGVTTKNVDKLAEGFHAVTKE